MIDVQVLHPHQEDLLLHQPRAANKRLGTGSAGSATQGHAKQRTYIFVDTYVRLNWSLIPLTSRLVAYP
jgi:hypothetical protein